VGVCGSCGGVWGSVVSGAGNQPAADANWWVWQLSPIWPRLVANQSAAHIKRAAELVVGGRVSRGAGLRSAECVPTIKHVIERNLVVV